MSESESKERLLAAAKALMLSNGFAGTSVDAICKQAGLTKGSFYHFFGSKDELGLAVLEWSLVKGGSLLGGGPHSKLPSSPGRAFAFLKHVENSAAELWSGGCLLGTFALELAETNDPMQRAVARMFDLVVENFAAELAPLGKKPKDLAEQYLSTLEGSIILAKAHRDPARVKSALRAFRLNLSSTLAGKS